MSFGKQLAAVMLTGSLFLMGCEPNSEFKKVETGGPAVPEVEHSHHEHGPHDGHVIELGEHAGHAEIAYDGKTHKLTVYTLSHDDKSAMPVKRDGAKVTLMVDGKPVEVALTAVPQEGEADDVASQFEATLEGHAAEDIHDIEGVEGSVSVMVGDKSVSGELGHDDHDGHDHGDDHDHDDHDHDKAEAGSETK